MQVTNIHFAYGRIALTHELLGQFGQVLVENGRCNPPVIFIYFFEAPPALNQKGNCIAIIKYGPLQC